MRKYLLIILGLTSTLLAISQSNDPLDCYWEYEECTFMAEEHHAVIEIIEGVDRKKQQDKYVAAVLKCTNTYFECRNN